MIGRVGAGGEASTGVALVDILLTLHLGHHLHEMMDLTREQKRAIAAVTVFGLCFLKQSPEEGVVHVLGLDHEPLPLGPHVDGQASLRHHPPAQPARPRLALLHHRYAAA